MDTFVAEEFNCTMAPLNDPRMFLMANVSMPCPEGTVFKEVNCSCIHDPDYPRKRAYNIMVVFIASHTSSGVADLQSGLTTSL